MESLSTRRINDLQRRYGLSEDEYRQILMEQDGRCAICQVCEPGGRGAWHVDHDHDWGEVRGLLCHNCNLGLGSFFDDVDRLEKAIAYLESA